jgi:hypothetical protein
MSYKFKETNSFAQVSTTIAHPYENLSESELLIKMGSHGQFPLFYPNWIYECSRLDTRPISLSKARLNIKKMFDYLSRHKNIERKKIALSTLEVEKRNLYIKSFLRLVENKILDDEDIHLQ